MIKPYQNQVTDLVKSMVNSHQPATVEPKPANYGTIKTNSEFVLYLALNGVLGRGAYIATVEAIAKTPELTGYLSSVGLTLDDRLIENRRLELEARPQQSMAPRLVKTKRETVKPVNYRPEYEYANKNYSQRGYNTRVSEKEKFGIVVDAFARLRQGKLYDMVSQSNQTAATYGSNAPSDETEQAENVFVFDRYTLKPKNSDKLNPGNQSGLEELLKAV